MVPHPSHKYWTEVRYGSWRTMTVGRGGPRTTSCRSRALWRRRPSGNLIQRHRQRARARAVAIAGKRGADCLGVGTGLNGNGEHYCRVAGAYVRGRVAAVVPDEQLGDSAVRIESHTRDVPEPVALKAEGFGPAAGK
jgi:hypothetical protein